MKDKIRILSMGWGVQTWTLAAMTAIGEAPPVDFIVHADTGHEMEGTYSFAKTWTPWLEDHGISVATVKNNKTDVIRHSGVQIPAHFLDQEGGKGIVRRQCTQEWKLRPLRKFAREALREKGIKRVKGSVEMVIGISMDEFMRMKDSNIAYIQNVYPLVDSRMTRAGCISWLEAHNLPSPPKSACTFCPYTSKLGWKNLKRAGGSDWKSAVAVDIAIRNPRKDIPGNKFKGEMFVHSGRVPLPEAINIPEDHGAQQLSLTDACEDGYCWV